MNTLHITQMYQSVARESWQDVNAAYSESQVENNPHINDVCNDLEVYLYVFADGSWTIDHAQYIQSTNGCISAVPIAHYNGPAELAEDIEANEDWDAIEYAQ